MTSPDNHSTDLSRDRATELEHRLRARYLEAGDKLDAHTAGRLRAARRTALQALAAPTRSRLGFTGMARARTLQRVFLPAGAFAMIVLASLMIWQPARHPPASAHRTAATLAAPDPDNELPPDPDSTDPTLYQNLDFYDWLAANNSGKAMR
jgi:hypothetical protein